MSVNKQKKGIAIRYIPEHDVPEIIAIARGLLAERLLQTAKENNIAIYKDADLAVVLSAMKPGDSIPESLFRIMAEVLAYCYNINEKFRNKILKNQHN